MQNMYDVQRKQTLFFLLKQSIIVEIKEDTKQVILKNEKEKNSLTVPYNIILEFFAQSLITYKKNLILLTKKGLLLTQQWSNEQNNFFYANRAISYEIENGDDSSNLVIRNLKESPLAYLMVRKDKKGRFFLEEEEFEAGERFRRDYTQGNIIPKMGMNWKPYIANIGKGSFGSSNDITDSALAARIRVEKAIKAVGPELSGILIDVCCFLKGLEKIETERCWPVRSAKIILKTALSVLARHYNLSKKRNEYKNILHWGQDDYIPTAS